MKIQPLRCSSSIIAPVKVLSLCVYMWMSMKILTMYYQYRVVVTIYMYIYWGLHGHDRMVVAFTTTCAISAYHH